MPALDAGAAAAPLLPTVKVTPLAATETPLTVRSGRGTTVQPSTSMVDMSAPETALSTPELLNARNESLPAEAAQSPKSPPGLVLKLSRLVAPLSTEK